MMKFISTKTHGYLDYIVGVLLIVAPWMFEFYRGGIETWVPVLLGLITILYSLITSYELGATPQLPMRTHLTIDMIAGLLLLGSPWIFGFFEYVWKPHVVVGLLEILVVLFSKPTPPPDRRTHRTTPESEAKARTATE